MQLSLGVLTMPICSLVRIIACAAMTLPAIASAGDCPALLNREIPRLQDEKPQNLCQHAGKVLVIVNTASFCGYTSQYKGLEALQRNYSSRGLVVLGFPSNDFEQEPGNNKEIAAFCENTFGVKFPMFVKSHVSGDSGADLNPVYVDLRRRSGQAPKWNFHKYLVARDGQRIQSFASDVEPDSAAFLASIEKLLAEK